MLHNITEQTDNIWLMYASEMAPVVVNGHRALRGGTQLLTGKFPLLGRHLIPVPVNSPLGRFGGSSLTMLKLNEKLTAVMLTINPQVALERCAEQLSPHSQPLEIVSQNRRHGNATRGMFDNAGDREHPLSDGTVVNIIEALRPIDPETGEPNLKLKAHEVVPANCRFALLEDRVVALRGAQFAVTVPTEDRAHAGRQALLRTLESALLTRQVSMDDALGELGRYDWRWFGIPLAAPPHWT